MAEGVDCCLRIVPRWQADNGGHGRRCRKGVPLSRQAHRLALPGTARDRGPFELALSNGT
jgi:hypothetical protein